MIDFILFPIEFYSFQLMQCKKRNYPLKFTQSYFTFNPLDQ